MNKTLVLGNFKPIFKDRIVNISLMLRRTNKLSLAQNLNTSFIIRIGKYHVVAGERERGGCGELII